VCRGIFSVNYLKEHFSKSENFPKADEVRAIYERLKTRWNENYIGLCKRKEAYTRTEFLDPLLKEIGWEFIPEQDLPSKSVTRKRPDDCLFLNNDARQRAAQQSDIHLGEKRWRATAVQDALRSRKSSPFAPASWTAPAPWRFGPGQATCARVA
jgi:hypothetical protein